MSLFDWQHVFHCLGELQPHVTPMPIWIEPALYPRQLRWTATQRTLGLAMAEAWQRLMGRRYRLEWWWHLACSCHPIATSSTEVRRQWEPRRWARVRCLRRVPRVRTQRTWASTQARSARMIYVQTRRRWQPTRKSLVEIALHLSCRLVQNRLAVATSWWTFGDSLFVWMYVCVWRAFPFGFVFACIWAPFRTLSLHSFSFLVCQTHYAHAHVCLFIRCILHTFLGCCSCCLCRTVCA